MYTTMPPTSTKKKQADSTKKRSRNDLTEAEQSDAESKEIKRRNTSKTPVRSTVRPLKGSNDVSSQHIPAAPNTESVVTNPKIDSSKLQSVEGKSESLLPPPANADELIPAEATASPSGTPVGTPKVAMKTAEAKVITETCNGVETQLLEVTEEVFIPDRSSFKWANLVFILVMFLAIASGGWVYERLSSQLAIGELRQNLQNCEALQSQDRLQDEYYIKELETQVRGWKQEAKIKDVELESLRLECQDQGP